MIDLDDVREDYEAALKARAEEERTVRAPLPLSNPYGVAASLLVQGLRACPGVAFATRR